MEYTEEPEDSHIFEGYGLSISDNEGELRDIGGIISELKEIHMNFNTHAMSSYSLYLKGQKEMFRSIIWFLESKVG